MFLKSQKYYSVMFSTQHICTFDFDLSSSHRRFVIVDIAMLLAQNQKSVGFYYCFEEIPRLHLTCSETGLFNYR